MNLRPQERAQLTALLGALASGMPGDAGLSIFGGIQDSIDARRQAQWDRQNALREALMKQRETAADRQFEIKKMILQAKLDQRGDILQAKLDQRGDRQSAISDIYGQLIPEIQGTSSQTVTERPNPDYIPGSDLPKTISTTSTTSTPGLSYQDLMGQFGALIQTIPGKPLSNAEFANAASGFDAAYTLGDDDLAGVTRDALAGMNAGDPMDVVMRNLQQHGQDNGFGSVEEQQAIASAVRSVFQSGAPSQSDPAQASQGGGSDDLWGALASAGTAGAAGAYGAYRALKGQGRIGATSESLMNRMGLGDLAARVNQDILGRLSPEAAMAAQSGAETYAGSARANAVGRPISEAEAMMKAGIPPGGWTANENINPGAFGRASVAGEEAVPGAYYEPQVGALGARGLAGGWAANEALNPGAFGAEGIGALAPLLLSTLPKGGTPEQQAQAELAQAQQQRAWDQADERTRTDWANRAMAGDPNYQWVLQFMIAAA